MKFILKTVKAIIVSIVKQSVRSHLDDTEEIEKLMALIDLHRQINR
jgi:hypothetical protein